MCTFRLAIEDPAVGGFLLESTEVLELDTLAIGAHGRRDLLRGWDEGHFVFDDVETALSYLAGGAASVMRHWIRGDLEPVSEVKAVALS